MNALPTYHFFVVNRDKKTTLRYEGSFVPRVGDTIAIGELYLKVVDVIVDSAQASGVGVQHALYVHVKKTRMPFDVSACVDLELNEFCERMKEEKKPAT
jgi:hypothetical protein